MLSLIKHISDLYFKGSEIEPNYEESNEFDIVEEENGLANELDNCKEEQEILVEPQKNLVENDAAGSYDKTGIVTLITDKYILIENKYMCEKSDNDVTNLQKGEKVCYLAFKVNADEDLKVKKIVSRYEENQWGEEHTNYQSLDQIDLPNTSQSNENLNSLNVENEINDLNRFSTDKVLERRDINKRTVVGKVEKRVGRNVFVDKVNFSINLDDVTSHFVPLIGDWVKLECIFEIDENVANFQGEILKVLSIEPLRQYSRIGYVTSYDDLKEFGMVEKTIVFTKAVCSPGYVPFKNDKVVLQCIESDQGIQQSWRALSVVPMEEAPNKYTTSNIRHQTQMPKDQLEELVKDKENIEITNYLNLTLEARSEKNFEVKIKNNGKEIQLLYTCLFLSKRSDSQLTLVSPNKDELQYIKPSNEVIYTFTCKGRLVGVSEELISFKFKGFKIGRVIKITVKSIDLGRSISDNISTSCYDRNAKMVMPETYEEGTYIMGVKPYKPAKFITNRTRPPRIPEVLWCIMNNIDKEQKSRAEQEFILADKIPILKETLSITNYRDRFTYLLHLEQIAQIQAMKRFDMTSAIMRQNGEFLTLNVPGLAEKRPSLIVGDRVVITFKWDSSEGEKYYEGFIHKIRSSDVYLKFDSSFHEIYHGEDCQVSFKASMTVINRCYTAIGEVVTKLGEEFLFPKRVVQKEPQYNFIDDDDNETDQKSYKELLKDVPKINAMDANPETRKHIMDIVTKKKKINWVNKKLNKYQKEAVKNILKGVARPLPYIIFGPPGTGKTITVCETILQILSTMPESRILIATPSNSSANLIAERLLDSEHLKPGDMVRLVAYHYLESDCIPEKLMPYCATADIAAEGSRADVNLLDPRGCRTSLTLSVLCRHPIIIGTCSALGVLYNMGCKQGHFTHVVIDEAGQANEPELMVPLSLVHASSTQVILAGDPKQLGPVNQSRLAGFYGLDESFLSRLKDQYPYMRDPEGFESGYDPRLITKLLINYRSLPDLLELPNKLFYEAELIPQVDPDDSEEALLLESLKDMLPQGRIGGPPAIVFHGIDGKNEQDPDSPSWYNSEEATQVYLYLLELYNRGLKPEDIGIITPYSKQVYRIKCLLAEFEIEIPKVGSVEEFQGQERKVIILSTVRTAEEKIKIDVRHALGFVSAGERLNVAITRARSLLIIIGSPKLLMKDKYWRSVLDHCISMKSYIGCDIK